MLLLLVTLLFPGIDLDLLVKILLLLHLLDEGSRHELVDLDVCFLDLSPQDVFNMLLIFLAQL